jgi:hypothetical protein
MSPVERRISSRYIKEINVIRSFSITSIRHTGDRRVDDYIKELNDRSIDDSMKNRLLGRNAREDNDQQRVNKDVRELSDNWRDTDAEVHEIVKEIYESESTLNDETDTRLVKALKKLEEKNENTIEKAESHRDELDPNSREFHSSYLDQIIKSTKINIKMIKKIHNEEAISYEHDSFETLDDLNQDRQQQQVAYNEFHSNDLPPILPPILPNNNSSDSDPSDNDSPDNSDASSSDSPDNSDASSSSSEGGSERGNERGNEGGDKGGNAGGNAGGGEAAPKKEKGSVLDFADPSLEMPSYMDPED